MAEQPSRSRVLVFLPSYGDESALPELVAEIVRLGDRYRALIVDDGSATPLAAPAAALSVRLPANFGLGVCTHVAFDHALRHGYGIVVRADADGQHRIEDIPRLVAEIDAGRANLVVGVRANHAGGALSNLARRGLKAYFRVVARWMTGGRAPDDVNSGFFAVDGHAMGVLNRNGFERFPEPEMFVLACRSGLEVVNIAVQQRRRADGVSTLGPVPAMQMFFRFNVFALNELLRRRRP